MPTVVLVHGANHGPWCWDRLAPHLGEFQILTPDLYSPRQPSPAAPDIVQAAVDVARRTPPVVVLGHSFGGLSISQLEPDGIDHVVYLAALVPVDDLSEALGQPTVEGFLEAMTIADGAMFPKTERLRDIWYADCSDADVDWCAARLRPHPLLPIPALVERAVYKHVPATYVTCEHDGSIDAGYMARATALIGRGVSWSTSHSPFLSRPELVAELIRSVI